jgi:hypothetical protein
MFRSIISHATSALVLVWVFLGDVAYHLPPITEKRQTHSAFAFATPTHTGVERERTEKIGSQRSFFAYHILSPSPLITSLHGFFSFSGKLSTVTERSKVPLIAIKTIVRPYIFSLLWFGAPR